VEENSIFEIFQTEKKRNKLSEKLKFLQEIEDLYFEEDEVFSQNSEKYYHDKNSVLGQNTFKKGRKKCYIMNVLKF
jgi:hypothetical protein